MCPRCLVLWIVVVAGGCGGGGGGDDGGPNPQAPPVNILPQAMAVLADTPRDVPLAVPLRGSDPEGGALTFTIVTTPSIGSLGPITQISADAAVVNYTPDPGATGADRFAFVAFDGHLSSMRATVTIGVGVHLVVGSVERFDGLPYAGVPIECRGIGASTGQNFSETTDADGAYLMALPTTWTGSIETTSDYRLVPPRREVSAGTTAMAGFDFVGSRNYFVDIHHPAATDFGEGREVTPFPSLVAVQKIVDPGDTVWVHAGTYVSEHNRLVELNRGGRPGMQVTYAAVPGAKVVLDVNGNQDCFHVVNVTDVVIRGFEIKNARRDAFRVQGSSDCVFENNIVHDSDSSALTAGIRLRENCERMTIRSNEIYRCSIGIISGPPLGTRTGIVIEGNYVHDLPQGLASEIGISAIETQGVIRDNVVARCEGGGIAALRSDVVLEGNVVFNCGDSRVADGFALTDGPALVAHRNVSFNNTGHGFFGNGDRWEHNVAFGNGAAGMWVVGTQVLRNNIAFENDRDIDGPGSVDSDANFWADGAFPAGEGPRTLSGDPDFLRAPTPGAFLPANNPGFVIDPRAGGFGDVSALFGLAAGSPAVDAGLDVGLPFSGSAPDMGAFERP